MDEICTWTEDEDGLWLTACDNEFEFGDGSPDDNHMKFCCYCGLPLKQVAYDGDIDDSTYFS